ncbi:hypothetical protein C1H46_021603 [Malus baccata]|uniref:RNase H type-1 domain-containing protein n=1 Tax=Malus baccata TaxID=106549 RepID=A0A540M2A2_MALBA|nr:hypothetical protein C1H46_021603 [Malus baccata]
MALAVRDGVLWAVAKGFQNVVIEGDSLQIVSALSDHSCDRSVIGHIVEDMRIRSTGFLQSLKMCVPMSATKATPWPIDSLAIA